MSREQLREASDLLRRAAESTDDEALVERMHTQSTQLAELADGDQGPDHGRLARHMNALVEIRKAADGDAADLVKQARDAVAEYRSGVEGV
ncbi:MAG: hypothetical protein ABEJ74_04955 [Haloferacaceae archaeon]